MSADEVVASDIPTRYLFSRDEKEKIPQTKRKSALCHPDLVSLTLVHVKKKFIGYRLAWFEVEGERFFPVLNRRSNCWVIYFSILTFSDIFSSCNCAFQELQLELRPSGSDFSCLPRWRGFLTGVGLFGNQPWKFSLFPADKKSLIRVRCCLY